MRETRWADLAFLERGQLSPGEDTPGFGAFGLTLWMGVVPGYRERLAGMFRSANWGAFILVDSHLKRR
jgi:hypothetical protein